MSRHSPGPWKADLDLTGHWRVWEGRHLIQLLSDGDWRSEANARLMAAAPDLLQALADAVDKLEDHRNALHRDATADLALNETIDRLRAVIATVTAP